MRVSVLSAEGKEERVVVLETVVCSLWQLLVRSRNVLTLVFFTVLDFESMSGRNGECRERERGGVEPMS